MLAERVLKKVGNLFADTFQGYSLQADEKIFELGFVNSMFAMQLVEFIESEFSIEIATEDLSLENFETVAAIARMVEKNMARDQAA